MDLFRVRNDFNTKVEVVTGCTFFARDVISGEEMVA